MKQKVKQEMKQKVEMKAKVEMKPKCTIILPFNKKYVRTFQSNKKEGYYEI